MEALANRKTWVFDLDNTLYPAHSDLFPQVQVKMNAYVADYLKLSKEEAHKVQKKYYVEYGTTLNGMMINHNIDPHEFLYHAHDIDYSVLEKEKELLSALEALDARKLVFTNGSRRHAEQALEAMGLSHVFEDIFDIVAAEYTPKPSKKSFESMINKFGINPNESVMVEDLSKNLMTADELGFATLLVWSDKVWHDEPKGHAPAGISETEEPHIHYHTNKLSDFLLEINALRSKNKGI